MSISPLPPSPSDVERLIALEARESLREAIGKYGGDEVFFVAGVDDKGVVEDVKPCAFGNENMTPVIEQAVFPGAVVLHNHPGGNLQPSQADIQVASALGSQGVGSYIINNEVTEIRVIVPAMRPRERQPLDVRRVEALLAPEGPLAKSMRGYEHRPQQTEMLRAVADALNDDGIAAIEAGTGTGKSIAYLVPAIHWAKLNAEKVVVSTNTINLQEQLISKDIPFLQKHLGLEFKAELMKGRNNYLCRRKAAFLKMAPDVFGEEFAANQIKEIIKWIATTEKGCLSDLSFVPDHEAWEQVACDGDNCARAKCPDYAKCFFFQARRRAASADVIVVNHHLLMADLAVRLETKNYTSTAVLPAYKRIIFDEAHNIEDVATRYFGINITRRALSRILSRLVHRQRSHFGLLPFLHDRLALLGHQFPSEHTNRALELLSDTLIPLRQSLAQSLQNLMDLCARGVSDILRQPLAPKKELKLRITPQVEQTEFWNRTLRQAIDHVAGELAQLSRGLNEIRGILGRLPDEPREELESPAGEIKSLANRLSAKVDQFKNFHTIGENQCRWIEVYLPGNSSTPSVRLISLPLEVQEHLNKAVYNTVDTVVMTSATLSVNRRFDFFLNQVGLNRERCEPDVFHRVRTQQVDTPFDFDRQALVAVPVDLPEPREPLFTDACVNFLLPALQISRGSAFVLFTSYRQLNDFHARLQPLLRPLGYNCLKQGSENRLNLLKRFKNDRHSILFATSSFWEGVDVPGDALKLLVLVKLPFGVPTDPLQLARTERLEAMGANAFSDYTVPQAVIRFKQGFGRLIRTREDRGAALVLDRRVATKPYGQVFLNSLPTQQSNRKPAMDILNDLRTFFDEGM